MKSVVPSSLAGRESGGNSWAVVHGESEQQSVFFQEVSEVLLYSDSSTTGSNPPANQVTALADLAGQSFVSPTVSFSGPSYPIGLISVFGCNWDPIQETGQPDGLPDTSSDDVKRWATYCAATGKRLPTGTPGYYREFERNNIFDNQTFTRASFHTDDNFLLPLMPIIRGTGYKGQRQELHAFQGSYWKWLDDDSNPGFVAVRSRHLFTKQISCFVIGYELWALKADHSNGWDNFAGRARSFIDAENVTLVTDIFTLEARTFNEVAMPSSGTAGTYAAGFLGRVNLAIYGEAKADFNTRTGLSI
jgi:hypothetical protein